MAGTEVSLVKDKFAEFKCDANEAVHFKLVRQEKDIYDDKLSFKPVMSHQVFGESESIFGYKDLKVELFYSASRLTAYLGVTFSEKIVPENFDGLEADDIEKKIAESIPPGYLSSKDVFAAMLSKDVNFKPFGELTNSYTVNKVRQNREFQIYKTDIETPGFREYHERLQPFLLWYVDAASFIDVDDDRWTYYLIFEKYNRDGKTMYASVGYMTIYNYFAYPEKVRPRISQVLILPPFQRQGHGAKLLQTFYDDCQSRTDILDITVEDPSEDFQRMRDFVDTKNCMKLSHFQPAYLPEGFMEEMAKEAQEKLFINRKQARRIYEILRLHATDPSNKEQYRGYRLDIKRRLNIPFQKNGRDFEKLSRTLDPEELSATMDNLSTEQRLKYLDEQFEELTEQYRHVLDRVSSVSI